MKENLVLIAGAIVFKRLKNGKEQWLIVKQSAEPGWEIPKVVVRKGESSVRAAIRYMAESGGMNARILEEVGRTGGSTVVNGKVIPRRFIYYLLMQRSAGETLGLEQSSWFDIKKAEKNLFQKKEKDLLRNAGKILKEWQKKHFKKS